MITEYTMTFFRPLERVESILLVLLYKTENIVVVCGVSLLVSTSLKIPAGPSFSTTYLL
jgi:hypothetical protein